MMAGNYGGNHETVSGKGFCEAASAGPGVFSAGDCLQQVVAALLLAFAGGGLPGGGRRKRVGRIYFGRGESAAGTHYYPGCGGGVPAAGGGITVVARDGRAFCVSTSARGAAGNVSRKQERNCVLGKAWISYRSGGEEILFGEGRCVGNEKETSRRQPLAVPAAGELAKQGVGDLQRAHKKTAK